MRHLAVALGRRIWCCIPGRIVMGPRSESMFPGASPGASCRTCARGLCNAYSDLEGGLEIRTDVPGNPSGNIVYDVDARPLRRFLGSLEFFWGLCDVYRGLEGAYEIRIDVPRNPPRTSSRMWTRGLLEDSWGPLGGLSGASWKHFGGLWGSLGCPLGHLRGLPKPPLVKRGLVKTTSGPNLAGSSP